MLTSFNCSIITIINNTFNVLDTFLVDICKENNETFIKIGKQHYPVDEFKVGHIKDYICDRRKVADSDRHAVKLWKVDIKDESDIKEKT